MYLCNCLKSPFHWEHQLYYVYIETSQAWLETSQACLKLVEHGLKPVEHGLKPVKHGFKPVKHGFKPVSSMASNQLSMASNQSSMASNVGKSCKKIIYGPLLSWLKKSCSVFDGKQNPRVPCIVQGCRSVATSLALPYYFSQDDVGNSVYCECINYVVRAFYSYITWKVCIR